MIAGKPNPGYFFGPILLSGMLFFLLYHEISIREERIARLEKLNGLSADTCRWVYVKEDDWLTTYVCDDQAH